MAIIDLGNIRMNWRGVYNPKTQYVRDDAVSYKGSSFIALKNVTNMIPATGEYWDVLAAGTDQLSQEGDLLIHDGNTPVRLARGTNAQVLQMVDKQPAWRDQSLDPSRRVWKLAKVNGMGGWHTRVYLMTDGTIKACGYGGNFSNGHPTGAHLYVPSRIIVADPEVRFVDVFSGGMQHYALTAEGDVWSWGHNNFGQLGHGDTVTRPIAKRIEFFTTRQIKIARVNPGRPNYHDHACAYFLTMEGQVYACGINSEGNLGNGTSVNQSIPVRCGALTHIVDVRVSGMPHAVYAIEEDGSLWVWGWNGTGQLGLGDTSKRETPIKHPSFGSASLGSVVKAVISCGYKADGNNPTGHGVVIQADGTLLVSGFNGEGQLGLGDTTQRNSFTPLKVDGECVEVFGGDGRHASMVALTQQGELILWGYNGYG